MNAALDHTTAFCIPEGNAGDKFRITFGELGGPRPRFLGKAKGEDAAHELRVAGPGLNESDSEMKGMTAQGRLQFEEKLEQIWKWTAQSAKPKKGSNKAVLNRVKRVTVHRAWGHSVKRVQRYLGIRPRASAALSGSLASLDLSLAMTRPVESVVFIAIDVEWFEFNHNIITEVGLAVLDTWQTVGIAPLANLKNWFRMIKSHHLRVAENAHAVNRVHVRGCENFFDFGSVSRPCKPPARAAMLMTVRRSSQFVKEKDMAAAIRSILEPKTAEGLTIAEYTEDLVDMVYLLPQGGKLVLGGTADRGVNSRRHEDEAAARIIDRCARVRPEVRHAKVLEFRVGVRPARAEVRVESERLEGRRLIHNYGHGGSGVTLSWGCAEEVLELLRETS